VGRRNRKQIQDRKSTKIGAPPGSAIYVGQDRIQEVTIELFSYNELTLNITASPPIDSLDNLPSDLYHWINVIGVHDVEIIKKISQMYNIHALTTEDILNTVSRPKCEIYENYIFTSLKVLKNELSDVLVEDEQLSIVLHKNVVISFQEVGCEIFEAIRNRLKNPESRARRKKADYLFFLLQDVVVDNYIEVVDILEEENLQLEKSILQNINTDQLTKIQKLKSEVAYLKRIIYPVKESILKVIRSESKIIESETKLFFSDVLDHINYTHDSIEAQYEIIIGHRELYLSMMSISMNSVMKLLTIISSIFIPLTFIVGVYGMNFDNMPELRMQYGYFIILGIMLTIAIGMIIYFKRKHWM
jgi:magnesium transporter